MIADSAQIVTPIVTLLGGGALTTLVVKVMERRRSGADTHLVEAQAGNLHIDSANGVIQILVEQSQRSEVLLLRSEDAVNKLIGERELFRTEVQELRDQLTDLHGVVSALISQLNDLGVTPVVRPLFFAGHPPMPPIVA